MTTWPRHGNDFAWEAAGAPVQCRPMADEQAVVRKVLWRLVPFGVVCYLMNYVDRVNVSVASLTMVYDQKTGTGIAGFSEKVFTMGTAIFFLGYFIFELPSNLIQERVGPRRWIARIMISWGLITMMFVGVRGAWSFYGLRFLLGVAEAGFFPGMILYLSHWVPHEHRARASAMFLTSTAIAGVIGNPLGGVIMYAARGSPLGLASWQWLFLTEGLPSVLLGVVTLFYLTDRPADAVWLTAQERTTLAAVLKRENDAHPGHGKQGLLDAFKSRHTWVLTLFYSMVVFAFYMVNFYTPRIIRDSLVSGGVVAADTPKVLIDLWVCLFAAIPFGAAAVGMVLIGRHSDKTNERKMHLAFACLMITAGMTLAATASSMATGKLGTVLTITGLSVSAIGSFGIFGPFWALPPQLMTGTAAAAAFAIINSIGNLLGGFLGPMLQNVLNREQTMLVAAGLGGVAMVIALVAPIPRHVDKVSGVEVVRDAEPDGAQV
ncbi:MAG TPA: MFS transporter [Phycisphaerae bacterium]